MKNVISVDSIQRLLINKNNHMLSLWYLSELNNEGASRKNLKLCLDSVTGQDLDDLKNSMQGPESHRVLVLSALIPETKASASDFKISNFVNAQKNPG